ncbi:hypothetical protein KY345_04600 [Candidatus Woesearchaeota archaeon]|nr:hypothetical protein [Candidatus Woesearchaeota archaeon]
MIKKILLLLSVCILLTGCGITGKVVESLDQEVEAQLESDYSKLVDALDKEDPTPCYYIMTQNIREDCFIRLAKKTDDKSVCSNLLSGPKDECLSQFD